MYVQCHAHYDGDAAVCSLIMLIVIRISVKIVECPSLIMLIVVMISVKIVEYII
jgi:hypothetical protein